MFIAQKSLSTSVERRCISLFLSYTLLITSCGPRLEQSYDSSLYGANPPSREAGIFRNSTEIGVAMKELSSHTESFLKCSNYQAMFQNPTSECQEIEYHTTDTELSNKLEEENHRLWLRNLLIAEQRSTKERQAVMQGIYINEIRKDIEYLQDKLKERFEDVNRQYFAKSIGEDAFARQYRYVKSFRFVRYLQGLGDDEKTNEIKSQLALLRAIDGGFFDDPDNFVIEEILRVHSLFQGYFNMAGTGSDTSLEAFFADLKENYDGLVDEILGSTSQSRGDRVEEALRDISLEATHKTTLLIWQDFQEVTASDASELFLQAFKQLNVIKGENIDEVATNLEVEDDDETRLVKEFKETLEKMKESYLDGVVNPDMVTSNMSKTLSLLLKFDKGPLRILVMLVSVTMMGKGGLPSGAGDLIGTSAGILFTMNHLKVLNNDLAKFYGNKTDFLQQRMKAAWQSQPELPGFRKFQTNGGKLLRLASIGSKKVFPQNSTIAKVLHKIYTKASLLNFAILATVILSVYSAATTFESRDDFHKFTALANVALSATWLTLNVTLTLTLPGVQVIIFVVTALIIVVALLDALIQNRPKTIEPAKDDESRVFYESGIHYKKSYFYWCNEAQVKAEGDEPGKNCQQNWYASEFVDETSSGESIIRTRALGGLGGPINEGIHGDNSNEDERSAIKNFRMERITTWTCAVANRKRLHGVGLAYTLVDKDDPKNYVYFHMGCGTYVGDRMEKSIKTLIIPSDDYLEKVDVFHTRHGNRTERVIGFKFYTKNGSSLVSYREQDPDKFNHWATFHNSGDFSKGGEGPEETGSGPIMGFHGRTGASIDSIGIYVRTNGN